MSGGTFAKWVSQASWNDGTSRGGPRGDACVARGPEGHNVFLNTMLSARGRLGNAGVAPTAECRSTMPWPLYRWRDSWIRAARMMAR
jgi:hypothetical protein